MVKMNDTGNDLEMMKNIDDKFQALLSEFYKNIDKTKLLEQKVKEPAVTDTSDNVEEEEDDDDEAKHDTSSEESEDENSDVGQNEETSSERDESHRVIGSPKQVEEIEENTVDKQSESSYASEEKEAICLDSYTVGQMVEKLERKLQQKEDVSNEITRFKSGEYQVQKQPSPKVHFDDTKSIYSTSTSFKRKRRLKRSVQFSLHSASVPSSRQLLPKASMTASSIGSKKRKKKKFPSQNVSNVNWINYNRENLIKYRKKKEEQQSKTERSKSSVILRTVDKAIGNDNKENEEKCILNQGEKTKVAPVKKILGKPATPPVEKLLRPVKSAHSRCIAVEPPAAKEVDVTKQMSQAERDFFATIPFVVGRSISKTYHIGLSFQQTMSMIKRFSVCRDMVVTPIASCAGDTGLASPVSAMNHRCAALERGDECWEEEGWDLEASRRRAKCTCLPEPKRSSTLRKVIRQLLARSEANKPSSESGPKAVRPSKIHLRMN